ncbi:MAG: ABC transporter ATP-binding protein [Rickettsiales bacterium]
MSVLKLKDISKNFSQGNEVIKVLHKVDLEINRADVVALVGDSGSGKSTLLHIASTLLMPTEGEVRIDNQDTKDLSDDAKSKLRLTKVGVIYQDSNLLSDFTALENVCMPLKLSGQDIHNFASEAKTLLNELGLKSRMNHYPSQLSGGEQQRVAIARALVNKPKIIFADEPTGNLDAKNAENVINLFIESAKKNNTAVLIVTHDPKVAAKCKKVYELENGEIKK